jgi:O-methyltransferase
MKLLKRAGLAIVAVGFVGFFLVGVITGAAFLFAKPANPKMNKPLSRTNFSIPAGPIKDRYLELLKLYLTRSDFTGNNTIGIEWPAIAETMLGVPELNNIQNCIKDALARKVPGDLIEAGVWRGGATIFMRAALEAYGDSERHVWVADSFEGLPKATNAVDKRGGDFASMQELAVSLEEVRGNFARYGLLDSRVHFLQGWFSNTLPKAPIARLAVLRIDADMYVGTFDALKSLYPKLSPGGYCIIDDYSGIEGARKATDDYRAEHGITTPIQKVEGSKFTVFWQKAQ